MSYGDKQSHSRNKNQETRHQPTGDDQIKTNKQTTKKYFSQSTQSYYNGAQSTGRLSIPSVFWKLWAKIKLYPPPLPERTTKASFLGQILGGILESLSNHCPSLSLSWSTRISTSMVIQLPPSYAKTHLIGFHLNFSAKMLFVIRPHSKAVDGWNSAGEDTDQITMHTLWKCHK